MADTDLIACLYPVGGPGGRRAKDVIKANANRSRYVESRLRRPLPKPSEYEVNRSERQLTEPLEEREEIPAYIYKPCLQFRFSRGPQTPHGFVFGRDPNSDVVLPGDLQALSFHHFALTFDDHNRPIVKDLGSSGGTEVTFDNEGEGKRSDFVWIVGGHRIPDGKEPIIIHISNELKFQIILSRHDPASQLHVEKVQMFRQGAANADNLLSRLDLRSRPQTERASGTHTPGAGPIFLTKKLGEGAFGVVTHLWDVSTGNESVVKEPSLRAIRQKRVDVDAWKKEAHILGQVSHDHIMKILGAAFTPMPQLHFEYLPGGALEDHEDISSAESVQILQQCLSALKELHGHNPPIVHRDIKPGNILVKYRHPGNIYVKFGDFGLSRGSSDPTTICGTPQYLAPEIYYEQNRRNAHFEKRSYTPAVDIWSLGVAVFGCAYDLPSSNARGIFWCEEIVKNLKRGLQKNPDGLSRFLGDNMVIMRPELRRSAHYCYDQAMLLTDCLARESQHSASQYYAADSYGEDQQPTMLQDAQTAATILRGPSQYDYSIESAKTRSHGSSSDASVSTVSASTKKRSRVGRSSGKRQSRRIESLSSQQRESEVRSLSGLWDPLHELGGGSSLAAFMGQEASDLNARSTPTSTSRSIQEPMGERSNSAQPLKSHLMWGIPDPDPDLYIARGDSFAQGAPVGRAESNSLVVGIPWADSEQELAAQLRVELSNGRGESTSRQHSVAPEQ